MIGSAGSPEKVAHLTGKLGFNAAFDYHDGPVLDRLREAAPDGIDVYFDNVGGEQLRAAIEVMTSRSSGSRAAYFSSSDRRRAQRHGASRRSASGQVGGSYSRRGITPQLAEPEAGG